MVDSISNNGNPLQDANLLQLNARNVQDVNRQSADGNNSKTVSSLNQFVQDQVDLSQQAQQLNQRAREAQKFSRLAQQVGDGSQPDKVALLKDMVNSGRINEYLRGINTDDLAQKILNSSSGAFLQQ